MKLALSAAALSLAALATPATAAPPMGKIGSEGLAVPVASWQYHANCGWRNGKWVVDLGAGKIVICRPNRPSRDYIWYKSGSREGWYDRRKKSWHNKDWGPR